MVNQFLYAMVIAGQIFGILLVVGVIIGALLFAITKLEEKYAGTGAAIGIYFSLAFILSVAVGLIKAYLGAR